MKHKDIVVHERDLTQWNVYNSKKRSVKTNMELLRACSENYAIELADEIALMRERGEDTTHFEVLLQREIDRFNTATRVFCGRYGYMAIRDKNFNI